MFLIRAQQEARLREGSRSAFVGRLEQHISSACSKVAAYEAAELRQFVERQWEAARNVGFKSERAICVFMEAVCRWGEDFTSQPWARAILHTPGFEEKKVEDLRHQLLSGALPANPA